VVSSDDLAGRLTRFSRISGRRLVLYYWRPVPVGGLHGALRDACSLHRLCWRLAADALDAGATVLFGGVVGADGVGARRGAQPVVSAARVPGSPSFLTWRRWAQLHSDLRVSAGGGPRVHLREPSPMCRALQRWVGLVVRIVYVCFRRAADASGSTYGDCCVAGRASGGAVVGAELPCVTARGPRSSDVCAPCTAAVSASSSPGRPATERRRGGPHTPPNLCAALRRCVSWPVGSAGRRARAGADAGGPDVPTPQRGGRSRRVSTVFTGVAEVSGLATRI